MMPRLLTRSGEYDDTRRSARAIELRAPAGRAPARPSGPRRAAGRLAGARAGWQERVAALATRVVLVAGVWSALSIVLRHRNWHWPVGVDRTLGLVNVPAEPSLFTAAVMVLLAGALRRRLRAAWLLAVAFEFVIGVLQLVLFGAGVADRYGLPTGVGPVYGARLAYLGTAGVLGVALAPVLWACRGRFPARLRSGSLRAATVTLTGALAASILTTVALTEAFPHTLHAQGQRVVWAVRMGLGAVTDVDTPVRLHGQSGPHWLATMAGVLSALALLAAVRVFTRTARAKECLTAGDELAERALLHVDGERDSLGYFETRRDKAVIFSTDRQAAISYRVVASVSLASGDPIGPRTAWPGTIDAWLADARAHGWVPAVLGASEPAARAYAAAGLRAIGLGDEAVVDVESFTLHGPRMRAVRQAVTRIERAGYTLRVRRAAEIDRTELTELGELAERWRGDATERGFSMALNRIGDPTDERCVLVTAHDRMGELRALLSFVPWGARGLSLDLMRRDRHAENGLIEYLVAGLLGHCPTLGISRVSLNFAMFRSVFAAVEQVGAGPVTRLTATLLSFASRFWQIESLYRSNAKYAPGWRPRFMCYAMPGSLARVAVAAGMAEGFLPSPLPHPRATPNALVTGPDGEPTRLADAVRAQRDRLTRTPSPARRLDQQQATRRNKIGLLRAAGRPAYPVTVPRSHTIADVCTRHAGLPAGQRGGEQVSVAGRVRALRDLGGVSFAVLVERDARIQVMLTAADTPAEVRSLWRRAVDLGDQVSVSGEVITSNRGELSVLVTDWAMAGKCLHPLPNTHTGLVDARTRARHRHLDLLTSPAAVATLRARSTAVAALRATLASRGFTEVETPMLQAVHGGAAARPFRTHSNAYDTDLYLRIAPELYLKRLAVAGMDRIYELNRNFRNEGADSTHNPEFTSIEAYQAHADYTTMRHLTRELILAAATAVHDVPAIARTQPDGARTMIALDRPWPVVPVHDAVAAACRTPITPDTPATELRELCVQRQIPTPELAGAGDLVVALYEALVEKQTTFPTFYIDFPLGACPLTRAHRTDPRLAERWDLVAFGAEIGTAYSELTDPIDQRARLTEQSLRAAGGDPEAMQLDEAFLTALEYAMPPTGGLGLGVDRLVMLLTGAPIRATLAFPFVKPADQPRR